MTPAEKLSLCRCLKDAQEHLSDLFEALVTDTEPKVMVFDASRLVNRAGEILAAVHVAATPAPAFTGRDVVLDLPELDDDALAQRAIDEQWAHDDERLEAARREAGLTALLDDTAGVLSHDRDNRGAA